MKSIYQKTIDQYEERANDYIQSVHTRLNDDIVKWLNTIAENVPAESKIFEVGSGTGRDADYLDSKGYHVVRSEVTRAFINYQKANNKNILYFDVLDDKFNQIWDIILINSVLVHFTHADVEVILHKVYSALRHHGRLGISVKNSDYMTKGRSISGDRFFTYYHHDEIKALLEKIGFRIITSNLNIDHSWIMIIAEKL